MFSKANLVSTLVATIWGVGGGFLLWGIVGEPLMADHMQMDGLLKETPDMAFLVIGCLIQAFAFCSIYGQWAKGSFGAGSGITFGAWLALLIGLGEKLIDYATANLMNLQGTIMNFVIYLVFFGVTGLLAGLIYNKLSK